MDLLFVWITVLSVILLGLLYSRVGRSFFFVLVNHWIAAWQKTLICVVCFLTLVFAAILILENVEDFNGASFDMGELRGFAREEIRRGVLENVVSLGDSLTMLTPEVAAIVPTAVMCLREVSGKDIVPVLTASEPYGIELKIEGFKSFKNRGINTRKLLQKRLGRDYEVFNEESSAGSFIKVYYNGLSWDEERLLALPAFRAAYRGNAKPEDVMAFVAVAENFGHGRVNFVYDSGFVGLDSVASLLKNSEPEETGLLDPKQRKELMFKNAFYAIAEPFLLPGDSAEAGVYAGSALRFSEYYKKYGL